MRVTVRLNDTVASHVESVRQDDETSDAEAVRECIRRSQRLAECRDRVAELETNVERLQREKQQILDQREEHTELVRAVEQEQSLAEKKARAGLSKRLKWWLVGMPEQHENDNG